MPQRGIFVIQVAGVGVEPTPSGYEPDEVPFLYPAATERITRWG